MKKKLIPVVTIMSISLLCMCLIIYKQLSNERTFIPPSFESASAKGIPSPPEEVKYTEISLDTYKFSLSSRLLADENNDVDLFLTNPETNHVWLKARITDNNGHLLGETGILRPGEYVQSLHLADIKENTNIYLKIMGYEPETFYSLGSAETTMTIERKSP